MAGGLFTTCSCLPVYGCLSSHPHKGQNQHRDKLDRSGVKAKELGAFAWITPRDQWSPLRWCPLNLGAGTQHTERGFQTTGKRAEASTGPEPRSIIMPPRFSDSQEGTARHKNLGNWRAKRRCKRALSSEVSWSEHDSAESINWVTEGFLVFLKKEITIRNSNYRKAAFQTYLDFQVGRTLNEGRGRRFSDGGEDLLNMQG